MVDVLIITNPKTKSEIDNCLEIRNIVFCKEQGFPLETELDDNDYIADHFLLKLDGNYIGTSRLFKTGDVHHIGRVAVLKEHRGNGYGKLLINESIKRCKEIGGCVVECGAQVISRRFYESLGFKVKSEEIYKEAEVDHVDM
jgi:predicted GNAT family N-acyltransferase